MDTEVMAINPASVKSHQNYCDKKGFEFPILSDPGGETVKAFGVSKLGGLGVARSVFALNPKGKIIFAEKGQADLNQVRAAIEADGN